MHLLESNTHSFIVRVWLEETAEEAGQATWRGHITHVPSGERRYVKDLDEITAFMVPYLEGMGAKFGTRGRVRQWLKRWKLYLKKKLAEASTSPAGARTLDLGAGFKLDPEDLDQVEWLLSEARGIHKGI